MDRYDTSDDVAELRRAAIFHRRQCRRLRAHPDPRDPDHPGYPDDAGSHDTDPQPRKETP